MTNDQLAALDRAATQGVWKSIFYDAGDRDYYDHNGPTPGIFCDEADCGIVHWDGFKQKYWSSANGHQAQIEANAALIVALVNAYRTGKLVLIDDGAVEDVARALAQENGSFPTDDWKHYTNRATAALAALGGK